MSNTCQNLIVLVLGVPHCFAPVCENTSKAVTVYTLITSVLTAKGSTKISMMRLRSRAPQVPPLKIIFFTKTDSINGTTQICLEHWFYLLI